VGPLYLSIKGNSLECVRLLLDRGASIFYEDLDRVDNSPVIYAIRQNKLRYVQTMCLKAHINKARTSSKLNLLHYAISLGHFGIADFICSQGVNLDEKNEQE